MNKLKLSLLDFPHFRTHNLMLDDDQMRSALQWAKTQPIHSIEQLVVGDLAFLWILPQPDTAEKSISADLLNLLTAELEKGEFENSKLLALLREFATKHNLKFTPFMKFLRGRLSGMPTGPKVGEMMEILGPKFTIQRIRAELRTQNNDELKKSHTV